MRAVRRARRAGVLLLVGVMLLLLLVLLLLLQVILLVVVVLLVVLIVLVLQVVLVSVGLEALLHRGSHERSTAGGLVRACGLYLAVTGHAARRQRDVYATLISGRKL